MSMVSSFASSPFLESSICKKQRQPSPLYFTVHVNKSRPLSMLNPTRPFAFSHEDPSKRTISLKHAALTARTAQAVHVQRMSVRTLSSKISPKVSRSQLCCCSRYATSSSRVFCTCTGGAKIQQFARRFYKVRSVLKNASLRDRPSRMWAEYVKDDFWLVNVRKYCGISAMFPVHSSGPSGAERRSTCSETFRTDTLPMHYVCKRHLPTESNRRDNWNTQTADGSGVCIEGFAPRQCDWDENEE